MTKEYYWSNYLFPSSNNFQNPLANQSLYFLSFIVLLLCKTNILHVHIARILSKLKWQLKFNALKLVFASPWPVIWVSKESIQCHVYMALNAWFYKGHVIYCSISLFASSIACVINSSSWEEGWTAVTVALQDSQKSISGLAQFLQW